MTDHELDMIRSMNSPYTTAAVKEIERLRAALEKIAKGRWTDSHGRNPVATREAEIAIKALTR